MAVKLLVDLLHFLTTPEVLRVTGMGIICKGLAKQNVNFSGVLGIMSIYTLAEL